jgi:hypothetical protein
VTKITVARGVQVVAVIVVVAVIALVLLAHGGGRAATVALVSAVVASVAFSCGHAVAKAEHAIITEKVQQQNDAADWESEAAIRFPSADAMHARVDAARQTRSVNATAVACHNPVTSKAKHGP